MGYGNYKNFRQTLKKLNLEETDEMMFPSIEPVQPSEWLLQSLLVAERLPLTNEKSKAERVISPVLAEVAIAFEKQFTMYSGEDLTVDASLDLAGECDFFYAKHPRKSVMQAPVVTFVEAKDEDFEYGQAQCTAQMYGSLIYNEQEGRPVPFVYGCAVTGDVWKFMKLEKNCITLDIKNYYINELPKLLGIFHHILKQFLP
ncbi:MAG: hypothetical protein MUE85_10730 [Microscillaceae bacterium]|jgi:hypothetical protein|nr:hypothetical protein [Microscillaceae bacterium]